MLIARLDGQPVRTNGVSTERKRDCTCPGCGQKVFPWRPIHCVHHFKHARDAGCSHGAGETAEHLQAKTRLFEALQAKGFDVELECRVDLSNGRHRIVDVLALLDGETIALELQHSTLSDEDRRDRPADYRALGFHQSWIGVHGFYHHECRTVVTASGLPKRYQDIAAMNDLPMLYNPENDTVYDLFGLGRCDVDDLTPFLWDGGLYFEPFQTVEMLERAKAKKELANKLKAERELKKIAAFVADAPRRQFAEKHGLRYLCEAIDEIPESEDGWAINTRGNYRHSISLADGSTLFLVVFQDAWGNWVQMTRSRDGEPKYSRKKHDCPGDAIRECKAMLDDQLTEHLRNIYKTERQAA